jgi:hypothetical protein
LTERYFHALGQDARCHIGRTTRRRRPRGPGGCLALRPRSGRARRWTWSRAVHPVRPRGASFHF